MLFLVYVLFLIIEKKLSSSILGLRQIRYFAWSKNLDTLWWEMNRIISREMWFKS